MALPLLYPLFFLLYESAVCRNLRTIIGKCVLGFEGNVMKIGGLVFGKIVLL